MRRVRHITGGGPGMSLVEDQVCHWWRARYVTGGGPGMSLVEDKVCDSIQWEYQAFLDEGSNYNLQGIML